MSAQVTALTEQLAASNAKVSSLEESLTAYKAAEKAAEDQKKTEMLNAYRALSLTAEEMAPIEAAASTMSLDELESKLAVAYARKIQSSQPATRGVQVNVGAIGVPESDADTLPEFMKRAIEIDKQLHGGITLKA